MKNIVITGASSGLGEALALSFSTADINLFLGARTKAKLDNVAAQCAQAGASVFTETIDVTDADQVSTWITKVDAQNPIDLCICNAGILEKHKDRSTLETIEQARRQVETNLMGAINTVTAVAPAMKARKSGQIALIASLSALQPLTDAPSYSASKAGLKAYGEAMGFFLKPFGVSVNTICPGYITTPMTDGWKTWRPFEISVETAAEKTKKAILSNRPIAVFPLPLHLLVLSARLVPNGLRRHVTAPFRIKS